MPKQQPKWKSAGYEKKRVCDLCGFRSKYSSQISVHHINGNLNDVNGYNLRSICLNCAEEIKKSGVPWSTSDLEPDL